MRTLAFILAAALVTGCQTRHQEAAREENEPPFQPGAAALVYTPPVAMNDQDLDLSREGRGPYAMGGIESTVIDTTWIYQDDRQRFDHYGDFSRFERRAVSTSVRVRQH